MFLLFLGMDNLLTQVRNANDLLAILGNEKYKKKKKKRKTFKQRLQIMYIKRRDEFLKSWNEYLSLLPQDLEKILQGLIILSEPGTISENAEYILPFSEYRDKNKILEIMINNPSAKANSYKKYDTKKKQSESVYHDSSLITIKRSPDYYSISLGSSYFNVIQIKFRNGYDVIFGIFFFGTITTIKNDTPRLAYCFSIKNKVFFSFGVSLTFKILYLIFGNSRTSFNENVGATNDPSKSPENIIKKKKDRSLLLFGLRLDFVPALNYSSFNSLKKTNVIINNYHPFTKLNLINLLCNSEDYEQNLCMMMAAILV